MFSKIYIAIILSEYQEVGLKRFIDHFQIKDKIIVIKYSDNLIKHNNLPKNAIRKFFSSKYAFLSYFFLILLKNLFCRKQYIFGNPDSKFNSFLRMFISGKNQIYVDDGSGSIHLNYNKLKKNSTIFTTYDIKVPSKLKKIKYFPKYIKKKKKTCDKILFIGSALVTSKITSAKNFLKIYKIISKKHKKFYYYPHRYEIDELKLLPKNFKIIKRVSSVEQFIYNYKYNFKLIYLFYSSSLFEIIHFNNNKNIKVLDITSLIDGNEWFKVTDFKKKYNYIKKLNVDITKV